jgi:hypothetical protein
MKTMKKKLLPLLLLTSLVLSFYTVACPALAESKPVIVAHLKGALEADAQLLAIIGNVTDIEWVVVLDELTSSDLADASMLIMSKADSSLEYTSEELSAISTWLKTGGKALWVAADSDYGSDQMRQPTANDVLEAVGSVLRIESCSVEDPSSNAGAPYRVLGDSEMCDEDVDFLVHGVEKALFHGPGLIVGYKGGTYYSLEDSTLDGVYAVMTTTEDGVVVDSNEPLPEVHEIGAEGHFVLMAMELDYKMKNVIIATGEAPFDQYTAMYAPEIRSYERYVTEHPQQGAQLFENIIDFVTDYADQFMDCHNQITTKDSQITSLQGQVSTLESEKSTLEDEVDTLEGEKATLEGTVSTLQSSVASLEDDVAKAKSSLGTWQMLSVVLLIVGLVVGVFVGPMIRKS